MANALQQALNLIGREKGPDFVLKIEQSLIDLPVRGNTNVEDVISNDSGISEVLNIIAFLVNTDANRVDATIDTTKSIPINTAGTQHDANFDVNGGGNLQDDNAGSLFTTTAVNNHPFVDLNTFGVPATGVAKNQKIPQGILKRRGGDATAGYNFDGGVDHTNRALIGVDGSAAGAVLNANTQVLMSRCVKQMINILIKVRDIFGPQGWTSLFNKIKTGGANKNHIKRTHRQHRRRYSSKQY
jgi:hypothetical protein